MEPSFFRRMLQRMLSRRVLRFGVVGLTGVAVNLAVLYLFADVLDFKDEVASLIAIEVSIISNFFLNNAWTFADKNAGAKAGFTARLMRYNLVSLVGLGIQFAAFVVLKNAAMRSMHLEDAGMWKYPAQLVGIAIAMAWNFLSNFWWTWAPATRTPSVPAAAAGNPERS